jgi:hypothetical protein
VSYILQKHPICSLVIGIKNGRFTSNEVKSKFCNEEKFPKVLQL